MERASLVRKIVRQEGRVETELWALCKKVAIITNTKPNRWLKYGEWQLRRALDDIKDAQTTNRARLLTWFITKKKYDSSGKNSAPLEENLTE